MALQFIKTAIRITPMLVYLLIFYCRCTLPDPKLEPRPCRVTRVTCSTLRFKTPDVVLVTPIFNEELI